MSLLTRKAAEETTIVSVQHSIGKFRLRSTDGLHSAHVLRPSQHPENNSWLYAGDIAYRRSQYCKGVIAIQHQDAHTRIKHLLVAFTVVRVGDDIYLIKGTQICRRLSGQPSRTIEFCLDLISRRCSIENHCVHYRVMDTLLDCKAGGFRTMTPINQSICYDRFVIVLTPIPSTNFLEARIKKITNSFASGARNNSKLCETLNYRRD